MVDRHRHPRRPAMLSAEAADQIVGDEDPAEGSALAHTSAWALLGVGDEEFGQEAVQRLRATIAVEGVDVVAHMWSRSPDFTLPGALWRLWLLKEWCDRDLAEVRERFDEGIRGVAVDLRFDAVIDEVGALLGGERTEDDLALILSEAAAVMRVCAGGDSRGAVWIEDPSDPLAHPVTTRARALLRTAEELEEASVRAAAGTLD